MPLFPMPRSIYEKIKAQAREEVYDAIFRESNVLTSDDELLSWTHPCDPATLGVELIEGATPVA